MEQEALPYKPEISILRRRLELSKSFSALRRVRPRVPFWQLAAHRIPTLWSLYRGLSKEAPGDNIRWRMRMFFERYRCLTSPTATRDRLLLAHRYLDAFRASNGGDERLQRVLKRYNEMIGAKREKEQMKDVLRRELAWQERLRHRPILTGAYLRPTFFNGPLPRMKPQPVHISMMIRRRRLARERRGEKYAELVEHRDDIYRESTFEEALSGAALGSDEQEFLPVFDEKEWVKSIENQQAMIRNSLDRDSKRASTPYPPDMLEAIKEARREKVRNKTRERQRELRGEVLPRTLERSRQRPPAHVRVKMSREQLHMDRVVRSVSEVGYVGMVKSQMGRNMKNPDKWKELETGKEDEQSRLDELDNKIREENERRRKQVKDHEEV
ncbi:hypothetical protein DFH11DRAFT_1706665 [Phellopilus nigrolimitatus]|nr:hypothetical protein DFH11DRAFT_1706665 [Phellopilus nigrolimitatus]